MISIHLYGCTIAHIAVTNWKKKESVFFSWLTVRIQFYYLQQYFAQVRREMVFTKVARLWNGPSFRGLKPILVTFHLFKDKEDILRKSSLLRGSNIYLTEDYSRKVRRQREELLKFAKLIKSRQNGIRCLLQYDRLFVGNDVYLYNDIEQQVQKVLMKIPEGKYLLTKYLTYLAYLCNDQGTVCATYSPCLFH